MQANFKRNFAGQSTYVCESCGKRTRETGLGEQGCGLCAYCFEVGGLENELSDGHITQEQFDAQLAGFQKQYNRLPKLVAATEPLLVTAAENVAQLLALKNACTAAIQQARRDGASADVLKKLVSARRKARRQYNAARKEA